MQLKMFSAISLTLLLSSCGLFQSKEPEVIERIVYVPIQGEIQDRPEPLELESIYFYAVSERNIDEFLKRFEKENGSVVFFAISVPDYERLSLNVAELKRYIEQQKQLVIYYETIIRTGNQNGGI